VRGGRLAARGPAWGSHPSAATRPSVHLSRGYQLPPLPLSPKPRLTLCWRRGQGRAPAACGCSTDRIGLLSMANAGPNTNTAHSPSCCACRQCVPRLRKRGGSGWRGAARGAGRAGRPAAPRRATPCAPLSSFTTPLMRPAHQFVLPSTHIPSHLDGSYTVFGESLTGLDVSGSLSTWVGRLRARRHGRGLMRGAGREPGRAAPLHGRKCALTRTCTHDSAQRPRGPPPLVPSLPFPSRVVKAVNALAKGSPTARHRRRRRVHPRQRQLRRGKPPSKAALAA